MLTSLVVELEAVASGEINGGTSRGVHGFWYRHWKEVDIKTADRIHQATDTPPFTISPVMGLPHPVKGTQYVKQGQKAWFRVVALNEALSIALENKWAPQLPESIKIAGVSWKTNGWTISQARHPWAGQISYGELIKKHYLRKHPPTEWSLELATATAFHGAAGHLPFPLPDSLLSSWMRRWQIYSPVGMPAEVIDHARNHLVVNSYRLKTIPVRYGKRLIVGCVGNYSMRALDLDLTYCAVVDTLVHYSFFVGCGQKTTQGMGMTMPKPGQRKISIQ